jgi:hypothetical protein
LPGSAIATPTSMMTADVTRNARALE